MNHDGPLKFIVSDVALPINNKINRLASIQRKSVNSRICLRLIDLPFSHNTVATANDPPTNAVARFGVDVQESQ